MSAETDIYEVTYVQDGRTVIVGGEIMGIDTAAKLLCPDGHPLRVTYHKRDGDPQVWWLSCAHCGPARFVRRRADCPGITDARVIENGGTRGIKAAAKRRHPLEEGDPCLFFEGISWRSQTVSGRARAAETPSPAS